MLYYEFHEKMTDCMFWLFKYIEAVAVNSAGNYYTKY